MSDTALRTGSDLIKAARAYAEEDSAKTWRLFAITSLTFVLVFALTLRPELGAFRIAGTVILGLINIRFFIFYHDTLHRAIFRDSKLGKAVMKFYGFAIMSPPVIWADSHNYHHAHTSKIIGSGIGSYPLLTLRMYNQLKPIQKLMYRLVRSPLNILFGYVTVFMLGMCVRPFFSDPKRYWEGAASIGVHFGMFGLLTFFFGLESALLVFIIPMVISHAMGSYLFYAQHTYPDMELRDRSNWEFTAAALRSSSMMEMGPVMHWFTGNIGYHHVHHLNHRIPFYRLEEAMNGLPELQTPGRTSLRAKDIWACLRLHIWDTKEKRMLTLNEAAELTRQRAQLVQAS